MSSFDEAVKRMELNGFDAAGNPAQFGPIGQHDLRPMDGRWVNPEGKVIGTVNEAGLRQQILAEALALREMVLVLDARYDHVASAMDDVIEDYLSREETL